MTACSCYFCFRLSQVGSTSDRRGLWLFFFPFFSFIFFSYLLYGETRRCTEKAVSFHWILWQSGGVWPWQWWPKTQRALKAPSSSALIRLHSTHFSVSFVQLCASQALDSRWSLRLGATRGVTVSMSTFLACHQCYCAGSSLSWGLNLRAVVCGIFWSSSPGVFSWYSGFLPSFIGLVIQPTKLSSNKCDFSSVKLNSWAVPSYKVARNTTCCTW